MATVMTDTHVDHTELTEAGRVRSKKQSTYSRWEKAMSRHAGGGRRAAGKLVCFSTRACQDKQHGGSWETCAVQPKKQTRPDYAFLPPSFQKLSFQLLGSAFVGAVGKLV
jgi:hypothetical protein